MSMKSKLMVLSMMAAALQSPGYNTFGTPISHGSGRSKFRRKDLTRKQIKARAKNKRGRKSRQINARKYKGYHI